MKVNRHIITAILICAAAAHGAHAGNEAQAGERGHACAESVRVDVRAGLGTGGAMPLGMPETIRGLDRYGLELNPLVEIDAELPLGGLWGIMGGLRADRKAMDITARVKNYHITIVRGGEELSGMFTGRNQTSESQWGVSIPVSATCNLGRARIFAGTYVEYVTGREFEGSAYDGYLRVGDPTGPKVELGTAPGDRGTYDFADDMRRVQWGAQAGADWFVGSRVGVYGMVQWGLCGIHRAGFHTISQTLYPIYATIGVTYRLK